MTADPHPEPSEEDRPLAELRRIESDPAYRALFLSRLDTAIAGREAERDAFAAAVAAAADRLRGLLRSRPASDEARREAVTVTLGAVAWTCCLAAVVAREWIA
ncbi:hypothetical protein ACFWUZ_23035 [Streptomyces sp. NPDC058646]|uniref:hypothetical protein n=1 Tax=Streptomyces sp. NPDC058646 TaxID=3346574 RepID=UPI003669FB36